MDITTDLEIPITVYLRDSRNGFTRAYKTSTYESMFYDDGTWNSFQWTEGNYECDCNRSLFLYDEVLGGEQQLECNSSCENIIKIDKIVLDETGKIIFEGE